ncbi:MAG: hypothetical protein IGS54_08045 [Elainella sp. C42_A2020_010]|nr:hypothetical protein [Elainella sp. C42_A2020_010]
MFRASRYWKFVRIDAASRCIIQDLDPVKSFYCQLFGELPDQITIQRMQDIVLPQVLWLKWYRGLNQTQHTEERAVNLWLITLAYRVTYLLIVSKIDQWIQRHLLALQQDESLAFADRFNAELSLRCYISEQIRSVCIALGAQFGERHGFAWYDLLRFVMDDTDPTRSICLPPQPKAQTGAIRNRSDPAEPYEHLAAKILRTFEPDRSSLATWTNMLTRQCGPLKAFLLEHGVYLISDWALLNDTEPDVLRRILAQTYGFPPDQVEQACRQLSGYHEVYRAQYRRSRTRGGCQPPTAEQLHQMIQQANLAMSPKELMQNLIDLASRLRQYRISRRGGPLPADSIDALDASDKLLSNLAVPAADSEDDDQTTFLGRYRQQLIVGLDQAITAEIQQRYQQLQRRTSTAAKASVFLQILQRYYCDRVPMTTIATEMGLKGQYEVTRLLKIDEFRSHVRQRALNHLRDCILELAKEYAHPDRLQTLDQQVEAALNEYLGQVILESSVRANSDQGCLRQNLFIQRLCYVIQRFP